MPLDGYIIKLDEQKNLALTQIKRSGKGALQIVNTAKALAAASPVSVSVKGFQTWPSKAQKFVLH